MFHPFEVERFLSEHEQGATFNFAESGVHPIALAELLSLAGRSLDELADIRFDYPQVNGTQSLRERIAALYPDTAPDEVLVTVGASEANGLVAATMLAPGDAVVTLAPTYRQLAGNGRNMGVEVREAPLVEAEGWALDTDRLADSVAHGARLIAVVNPNNPTGHILTNAEMDAVVAAAERSGAWIVADEVYAGAERGNRPPTPTFRGRHERVIAVNSMSKAYGLAGLRVGWVVAPREIIAELWQRHEYATIAAGMLDMALAEIALDPQVRPKLIGRARRLIDRGFGRLEAALARLPGTFSVVPPEASAMSFVRFDLPVGSRELALRLRAEQGVLVVPGDCFGMDDHLRVSTALPEPLLDEGLHGLIRLAAQIAGRAPVPR
jgi:aspartate/methionine/tyrosine aminotransferase